MKESITNYIRAGYPGLYVVSAEEARVENELKAVAKELGYGIHAWSVTTGLVSMADGSQGQTAQDALGVLEACLELPEKSLVVLRDFHQALEDANPVLTRLLKETLVTCKATNRCLVILGCRQVLPPELERELTVIHFALPDREQLGLVLDGICGSAGIEQPVSDERDRILEAAGGMTCTEAENACALSVVESRRVDPGIVAREKAQAVKKNGLLEIVEVKEGLADIGGLDLLKSWLLKRKDAFSARAREYGLPGPKGMLIVGIPGTGKSLTAKATATILGRPLLKLDAGCLFGSLVGQSEENLRSVIRLAEAIAPCVLWIDEIEKAFAGSRSSGQTDGGTGSRVFGTFISWMQDRRSSVFVVATANDVSALPPELLRKGRFDELWFVDLPNREEREAIWQIQIAKHGRKPKSFDLSTLTANTAGHTGAEIEQAVIDALYTAFDKKRDMAHAELLEAARSTVPLSQLMGDEITALRKWAQGRARPATTPEARPQGRRIAAAYPGLN